VVSRTGVTGLSHQLLLKIHSLFNFKGENTMTKLCPIPTHSEYGFSTKDECSEEKCAWWSDREKKCAILMNAIGSFYHIWGKEK